MEPQPSIRITTTVVSPSGKYIFSGHESFPCRSLWLKKGYDYLVAKNSFNDPEAVVALGVGKNMVSAIRFWLKAFGISNNDEITDFGQYLFDEETGKDKYLEDLATLWLLHYRLVSTGEAVLYWMLFCGLQRERTQFTREQALSYVRLKMAEYGKQTSFNENTVKKDIGVLLQNYLLPKKAMTNEDYSSLLVDLDLIRQNEDGKEYHFNVEGKRKVTKEVFMYALVDLKERMNDNTIPYETIQERVGLVFCMQDFETIAMLKELSKKFSKYMAYSDVAGIRQIQFTRDLSKETILDDYYENNI